MSFLCSFKIDVAFKIIIRFILKVHINFKILKTQKRHEVTCHITRKKKKKKDKNSLKMNVALKLLLDYHIFNSDFKYRKNFRRNKSLF
jgi:hypothetical protein